MLSATTEPGTAPKFLSVEMLKVPACIPIEPVFVLVPDNVSVPLPSFTKDPAPLITPDIALLPLSPVWSVLVFAISIFPALSSDWIVSSSSTLYKAPELTITSVVSAKVPVTCNVPAVITVSPE